jgi:uncharacterized protein YutE (UPF0331/DUF86 family)
LDLVRRKAGDIRHAVSLLKPLAALPVEEFVPESETRDAALHRLQIAIEASQAICNHIAANVPTRVPETLSDCFRALREAGILTSDLCERLVRMAGFRNVLVHQYAEVDFRVVHNILCKDLGDFEAYLAAVGAHLESAL